MLLAKPGGGSSWLLNLRNVPYREAAEALCELPGVGPKASLLHPPQHVVTNIFVN